MDILKEKIQKSSRIMAVITKVLCILLSVGLLIPVSVLIWVTAAPDTDFNSVPGLGFYSPSGLLLTSNGEIISGMFTIIVSAIFIIYILIIAYRIFKSIGQFIIPFSQDNAKSLKKIAVILLIYSIIEPIAKAGFYGTFASEVQIQTSVNSLSVILALIFFFISVLFSYGAELQRQSDETL